METFTPIELGRKTALELLQMRQRIVSELQNAADGWDGRDQSEKNLAAVDKALEENLRGQAMSRYNGIGSQSLSARDQETAEWFSTELRGS
jgi:hypothetical protein